MYLFIIEQKSSPGWEPDELDKNSHHFIAIDENVVVATARLREESDNTGKIERMAVVKEYRSQGVGKSLLRYILQEAQKTGLKKIWIQAQAHTMPFYKKHGFQLISEEYDLHNLGIPHIDMELTLK